LGFGGEGEKKKKDMFSFGKKYNPFLGMVYVMCWRCGLARPMIKKNGVVLYFYIYDSRTTLIKG